MSRSQLRDLMAEMNNETEASPQNWGIIGSGAIARQFAEALTKSRNNALICVGTRNANTPLDAAFGSAEQVVGYDAMLARDNIDAVYIATPHPTHAEWAIKAARSGKHVLCEKPIGVNAAEARAIFDAAGQAGVVAIEAFMYRTHPQTRTLYNLIESGRIGPIRMLHASYGYNKPYDAQARHFANELGGGAILDIGCYGVSMSRLIAGANSGAVFADPVEVSGQASLVETGVDESATATLRFADGLTAQIACSITTVLDNSVRIFGENGWIEITSPWFCSGRQGGSSIIRVHQGGAVENIETKTDRWLYALEADAFTMSVVNGGALELAPTPEDSIGNMCVLDAWRAQAGVHYISEMPEFSTRTFGGTALMRNENARMTREAIFPEIAKPLSQLAMGCMGFDTYADAQGVYDAFFEAGGNVFDTAHIYKNGLSDRLLGHWVHSRGIRDQVVILGKGAHSPNCYPEAIERELYESLERLQTDYLDIYFLHRDNLDVPAGEFVDVLHDLAEKRIIGVFGGSNWTLERIASANAYAEKNGKRPFSAVSNQFSLAEMLEPVWPDCISSSDEASIAWLRGRNMPLFAWSSQARGFFTDSMNSQDPATIRSWLSEKNLDRRKRAALLAERKGVSLPSIALAYLLHLDFPVFPIIGPLTVAELRMSLAALQIEMTDKEPGWLAHGTWHS